MEPKGANVAKAAAMLDALGVPDGDGVTGAGSTGTTREVRATEEEVEAQQILTRGERTTQIRDPNKSAARTRDVMGRFEPDGTPKKSAKTGAAALVASKNAAKEVTTMARAGTKAPPGVAKGGGEPSEATEERTTEEGAKPEPTRAEKARDALVKLRADRAARAKASTAKEQAEQYGSRLSAEAARLEAERTQTAAERAKWEAARKNPIAGFAELGLDPSTAFLELADAARKANTPEARIEALEALNAQRDKEFREYREQAEREKQQTQAQAERAHALGEFFAEATPDKYPYAHAYLKAEAAKQGIDPKVLWERAADGTADEFKARGHTPSYKSIATDIEEYAKEVVLGLLANLPPDSGSTAESAARKLSEAPTVPTETKGKKSATIGNEMVSSRLSNNTRRTTMAERMKRAEKFIA